MFAHVYLIPIALLLGMPLAMEAGRRLKRARLAQAVSEPDTVDSGFGALDGVIYALFGLLLAFIFSGAATRFDHRRELIAQEANAIGTAYLRIDLLPQPSQDALRPLFRRYLASRIRTHQIADDLELAMAEYRRGLAMQEDAWRLAVAGAKETGNPAVLSLVLQAFNDMIDITTTRFASSLTHPPQVIFAMLVIVAFAASFLSGTAMATSPSRPWPHVLAFTLVISATVYVILDIEYPRRGLIRVDAADQVLIDLLESMREVTES